jgi:hypothetical protein
MVCMPARPGKCVAADIEIPYLLSLLNIVGGEARVVCTWAQDECPADLHMVVVAS